MAAAVDNFDVEEDADGFAFEVCDDDEKYLAFSSAGRRE